MRVDLHSQCVQIVALIPPKILIAPPNPKQYILISTFSQQKKGCGCCCVCDSHHHHPQRFCTLTLNVWHIYRDILNDQDNRHPPKNVHYGTNRHTDRVTETETDLLAVSSMPAPGTLMNL